MQAVKLLSRFPVFVGAVAVTTCAQADTLWLKNGDKIDGTFGQISGGKLVWKSASFGDLRVDQTQVEFIESQGTYNLKINDVERTGCQFRREDGAQLWVCEGQSVPVVSWAEVGEAKVPAKKSKELINSGDLTVSVSDTSGNTVEESYALDVRHEARYGVTRHRLAYEFDYETADNVRTENQANGEYKYDLFFAERWYYNGNAEYERDEFSDLDARYILGSGVGYQVFDTETLQLSFENGVNYVWEYFGEDSDREYAAYRWDLDFGWVISNSGLRFFHRHGLWYSVEDSNDWEFESDTGFRLPVFGRLSSEFKFEYDYDNQPSETAGSVDRKWSVGVVYDW